jgi:hypothetical protein
MQFPQDQIDELKQIAPVLSFIEDGGYSYFLIKQCPLPEGCNPSEVDLLLCPSVHTGYNSRLFFAQTITGCPLPNWNGNLRLLDKNWVAISWNVPAGLRLAETLLVHLKAFRK